MVWVKYAFELHRYTAAEVERMAHLAKRLTNPNPRSLSYLHQVYGKDGYYSCQFAQCTWVEAALRKSGSESLQKYLAIYPYEINRLVLDTEHSTACGSLLYSSDTH